jgi:hypothetical protein
MRPLGKGEAVTKVDTPASAKAVAKLTRLANLLADRSKRPAFREDPKKAMSGAGIVHAHIPAEVIDLLKGLSDDELDLLGTVGDKLKGKNFAVESPNVGKIFFY